MTGSGSVMVFNKQFFSQGARGYVIAAFESKEISFVFPVTKGALHWGKRRIVQSVNCGLYNRVDFGSYSQPFLEAGLDEAERSNFFLPKE
jgi:hypothetical protein